MTSIAPTLLAAGLTPLTGPGVGAPALPRPRGTVAELAGDPESSMMLVERLQRGDADALDRLFARYLGPLKRWAHGRLPPYARSLSDTQDIVQDGILRVLANLATFRPERPGAFHAYLRSAVMSHVIDEIRRANRRPAGVPLDEDLPGGLPSPHQLAVEGEDREIYELALAQLSDYDRELVIGRLEWEQPYEELAVMLGRRSAAAVRTAARRAVIKLAAAMQELRAARQQ